jgi:lipid A 4'-phosphatase
MLRTEPRRWRLFAREALLVLLGLVAVSIAIRVFDVDRRFSGLFYRAGQSPNWYAKGRSLWEGVYHVAVWPANLTAGAALLVLIASFFRAGLRRHRRSCALLILTLLLGPGLLVNVVLKSESGRPRPRDIVEYGGTESFRPVGSIDLAGKGQAFPSGHASMGFYFLAFYILWRRSRPRAARAALAFGIAAGAAVGFQRVAVGAHFLSDVIWSGGIDYLVALTLDAVLPFPPESAVSRRS